MPLSRKQEEWSALADRLCCIVGVHVYMENLFLLAYHIRQQASGIVHLATRVRPLLKYDEWNDNHSLRSIDLRTSSTAVFPVGSTPEQHCTIAVALAKLILKRAGHPCTGIKCSLSTGSDASEKIRTRRYLLDVKRLPSSLVPPAVAAAAVAEEAATAAAAGLSDIVAVAQSASTHSFLPAALVLQGVSPSVVAAMEMAYASAGLAIPGAVRELLQHTAFPTSLMVPTPANLLPHPASSSQTFATIGTKISAEVAVSPVGSASPDADVPSTASSRATSTASGVTAAIVVAVAPGVACMDADSCASTAGAAAAAATRSASATDTDIVGASVPMSSFPEENIPSAEHKSATLTGESSVSDILQQQQQQPTHPAAALELLALLRQSSIITAVPLSEVCSTQLLPRCHHATPETRSSATTGLHHQGQFPFGATGVSGRGISTPERRLFKPPSSLRIGNKRRAHLMQDNICKVSDLDRGASASSLVSSPAAAAASAAASRRPLQVSRLSAATACVAAPSYTACERRLSQTPFTHRTADVRKAHCLQDDKSGTSDLDCAATVFTLATPVAAAASAATPRPFQSSPLSAETGDASASQVAAAASFAAAAAAAPTSVLAITTAAPIIEATIEAVAAVPFAVSSNCSACPGRRPQVQHAPRRFYPTRHRTRDTLDDVDMSETAPASSSLAVSTTCAATPSQSPEPHGNALVDHAPATATTQRGPGRKRQRRDNSPQVVASVDDAEQRLPPAESMQSSPAGASSARGLSASPAAAAEIPRPGLALNTFHVMDVMEGLRALPDCSIDVIITSSPYNKVIPHSRAGTVGATGCICLHRRCSSCTSRCCVVHNACLLYFSVA